MGMPSRKLTSDDEGNTNSNKKRKMEVATKHERIWSEDKMDESVKLLAKECPDCKSGNHKFWMFANHNLKQPRYKCLNNNCPREAYTVGGKVRPKKAQDVDVEDATSTCKVKGKRIQVSPTSSEEHSSFVFDIESSSNNQEIIEVDEVTNLEGLFDNNKFGKTSYGSDCDETSSSSDSSETSNCSDFDETSNSIECDEILGANESRHVENTDYENNFDFGEYKHLAPRMTKKEIEIVDDSGEDYSFGEEYTNKYGEGIELLTFVEYSDVDS